MWGSYEAVEFQWLQLVEMEETLLHHSPNDGSFQKVYRQVLLDRGLHTGAFYLSGWLTSEWKDERTVKRDALGRDERYGLLMSVLNEFRRRRVSAPTVLVDATVPTGVPNAVPVVGS